MKSDIPFKPMGSQMLPIKKVLLICGILAPVLYVVTDLLASALYIGYSFFSQGFSELWVFGSPVRQPFLPLVIAHGLLLVVFSFGIWMSAGKNRAIQVMTLMLIADAVVGILTPTFFPPPMRGAVSAESAGVIHFALTGVNVMFFILAMAFAVATYRKWFRYYSIATLVVLLVFGIVAGSSFSTVAANEPTPWAGIFERVNIYGYLLWLGVLATFIMTNPKSSVRSSNEIKKT